MEKPTVAAITAVGGITGYVVYRGIDFVLNRFGEYESAQKTSDLKIQDLIGAMKDQSAQFAQDIVFLKETNVTSQKQQKVEHERAVSAMRDAFAEYKETQEEKQVANEQAMDNLQNRIRANKAAHSEEIGSLTQEIAAAKDREFTQAAEFAALKDQQKVDHERAISALRDAFSEYKETQEEQQVANKQAMDNLQNRIRSNEAAHSLEMVSMTQEIAAAKNREVTQAAEFTTLKEQLKVAVLKAAATKKISDSLIVKLKSDNAALEGDKLTLIGQTKILTEDKKRLFDKACRSRAVIKQTIKMLKDLGKTSPPEVDIRVILKLLEREGTTLFPLTDAPQIAFEVLEDNLNVTKLPEDAVVPMKDAPSVQEAED